MWGDDGSPHQRPATRGYHGSRYILLLRTSATASGDLEFMDHVMRESSSFWRRDRALAVSSTLGILLILALARPARTRADGQSVWDGVYSKSQVSRGAAVYRQQCALCHGDRPTSGSAGAPALAGKEFLTD